MTTPGEPAPLAAAANRIRRVLAIGALALLGVTWRLWTPQNVFPRVPAFELVTAWPRGVVDTINWIALGACAASLVFLALGRNSRLAKAAAMAVAVSFLTLIVLDQHRLQPWVVHIALGLLLVEFAVPVRRIDYLRWFTVSIYVYSALGKFDAQFLHTVGLDFVGTLLAQLGWDIRLLDNASRPWLASALPLGELVVGIGLAFRRTQVIAAFGAIIMHLLLLSVLGPWGLHHAWGVLVWNMLFIAMDVLLFLWPAGKLAASGQETSAGASGSSRWVEALLVVAVVAPLGERIGLVDHWLGWALYAPHSSRVRVEISAAAARRLPAIVQAFVDRDNESELIWREVRLDRWSLTTLGAPVYPQQRFQLAVARALAERVGEREIRVQLLSAADRWTGGRTQQTLEGRRELDAATANFWFNTRPIFAPP